MVEEWRGRTRTAFSLSDILPFQSLASDSRIEQTYEDDTATLVITNVQMDDNGEYICRAVNDEGSDTSSAQLTVKGMRRSPLTSETRCHDGLLAHVPSENDAAPAAAVAQEDQSAAPATSDEPALTSAPEPTDGAASDTAAKLEEKLPSEAVAEVPASAAISTEPTPVEAPIGTKPAVAEKKPAEKKPAVAEKKPAAVEKKPVGAAALKKPEPAKKAEEKKEPAKKPAEDKTKKPVVEEKKQVRCTTVDLDLITRPFFV